MPYTVAPAPGGAVWWPQEPGAKNALEWLPPHPQDEDAVSGVLPALAAPRGLNKHNIRLKPIVWRV